MAVLIAAAMLVAQVIDDGVTVENGGPVELPAVEVEAAAEPLTPHAYLYASYPSLARRLDCVIARESRWDANAQNRRSGASGLAQFLLSTWLTTPPGRAGLSRFDPYANIDGAAWLARNVGWTQWQVVRLGLC